MLHLRFLLDMVVGMRLCVVGSRIVYEGVDITRWSISIIAEFRF